MDGRRDAVKSDPASIPASLGTIIDNTGKASLDVGDPHPGRVKSHKVHLHRVAVMDRSAFHEQNDAAVQATCVLLQRV